MCLIRISPSILSCDFSRMGDEFARMEACGADWLHIDVMDGHFVPNLTLGAPLVKCLRGSSSLPFDVHLMISHPLQYAPDFAKAGANLITFHVEAEDSVDETIDCIRAFGCTPGLAVKPGTPVEAVYPYLDRLGMVLVMTVEPGFGGQSFRADQMPKITALRGHCLAQGVRNLMIQVDGGISPSTIETAARAGADVFVAGSAVFGAQDSRAMIAALRGKAEAAYPRA